jgi:hypothetical protein
MARNCSALALCLVFVVSLGGCSSLMPQKRDSVKAPVILEEDVPDKTKSEPESPQEGQITLPPGSETIPPGLSTTPTAQPDLATRPPRRFKRGDRGWQSVPGTVDTKQP